jgi:hypothetical protein
VLGLESGLEVAKSVSVGVYISRDDTVGVPLTKRSLA